MIKENLELYCVTNKRELFLEKTKLILAGVGKKKFPDTYLLSHSGDNIYYKEENYSELCFHYWYWKNKLDIKNNNWIGFCQRRRHWIKKKSTNAKVTKDNLYEHIIEIPDNDWNGYDSIICEPINVNPMKKMKILKRGYRLLIKDPSIIFSKKKQNLLLHFDMHHGFGNFEKTIKFLKKDDQIDFYKYMKVNTKFNPHIMYISKS